MGELAAALIYFVGGALAAPVAHASFYVARMYNVYSATVGDACWKTADRFEKIALAIAIASMCCFAAGSFTAYRAFSLMGKNIPKPPATIQPVK